VCVLSTAKNRNFNEILFTDFHFFAMCDYFMDLCAAAIEECVKGSLQIGSTTITPIKPTATITLDNCGEEGSDRDEAEADDDEMEQGTSDEEVMKLYCLLPN
jgi:hypothetical protein